MKSLFALISSWADFFDPNKGGLTNIDTSSGEYELLQNVFNILSIVLWVVLGIVGAIGAIYAVYAGIRLARADEKSKRDEAKKHLIYIAVAVGVTLVLILFFNTFLPMMLDAFGVRDTMWTTSTGSGSGTETN